MVFKGRPLKRKAKDGRMLTKKRYMFIVTEKDAEYKDASFEMVYDPHPMKFKL